MKAMYILLIIGVIIVGSTFLVGQYYFEGVVSKNTYTESLSYNENLLIQKELSNLVTNIEITDYKVFYDIPTNYKVNIITISMPMGESYELLLSNNAASIPSTLKKGWYNLNFYIDNFTTPLKKGIYLQ